MTEEKPEWADNDDEDLLTEPAKLPTDKEDTVPMVELNEFAAANPADPAIEGEEGLA